MLVPWLIMHSRKVAVCLAWREVFCGSGSDYDFSWLRSACTDIGEKGDSGRDLRARVEKKTWVQEESCKEGREEQN